ncbi:MAG TPA: hypothetical protein VGW39_04190 [Chthoniobacterales bacterium]|nr:hypothetical protein [Chthoniobacterales bacterium]
MKSFFSFFAMPLAAVSLASISLADEVEWAPEATMDSQLFPSLLIATATARPGDVDDEEQAPDPYLLGDQYGLVGVSIKTVAANTKVKVTLKENDLMSASTWSGELPEAAKEYYIAPKVNYKFEKLRKMTQQMPLNVTFALELEGKPAAEKTETLQVRSINDCPFGVSNDEETLDDENTIAGSAEIGWMFAAYVNENHPMLDKILQEALATKTVNAFLGYQKNDPAEVARQVFAIWSALHKRGIQYSSTTTTPGGSDEVYSQYVRFLDQSLTNTQANCVDGSVLFASILRKISIKPFLVTVPGHMYVGFYLTPDEKDFVGLETTVIGAANAKDDEKEGDPAVLTALRGKLDEKAREEKAWKTYARAIQIATDDLEKNKANFEGDNANYQMIDLDEARTEGIMPIPYSAP